MKTARRAVVLIVVVGVAAVAALVATSRPDFEEAQDVAEARWAALRPTLDDRYLSLDALASAVSDAGGAGAAIGLDTSAAVQRWRGRSDARLSQQVRAGNELEGLARRLVAVVDSSDRLSGDQNVTSQVRSFVRSTLPEAARAYNAAVADYEQERDGLLREAAAALLGYNSLPTFDTGRDPE